MARCGSNAIGRALDPFFAVTLNWGALVAILAARKRNGPPMFQMLSCFNLKPGVDLAAFETALCAFSDHMVAQGLIRGTGPVMRRQSDTQLDTDTDRGHSFFFLTDFRDKAQSDAAFAYLESGSEPGFSRHRAVMAQTIDPIFICWERPGPG